MLIFQILQSRPSNFDSIQSRSRIKLIPSFLSQTTPDSSRRNGTSEPSERYALMEYSAFSGMKKRNGSEEITVGYGISTSKSPPSSLSFSLINCMQNSTTFQKCFSSIIMPFLVSSYVLELITRPVA
jgi:hypothetical protein